MRERAKNPVDEAVGARIRLLRKGRKISQEEFGKAIVVTFQQVQKYEIGENRIGASRLHLVALALNVPISELFDSTSGPVARRGRRNQSRSTGRRFASPKPSSKYPTKMCARRSSMWRKRWRATLALETNSCGRLSRLHWRP